MKVLDTKTGEEYNQKTFMTLHSTYKTTFDLVSKNIGQWFCSLPIDDTDSPIYEIVFNPSLPAGKNDNRIFNTYKGFAIEPNSKGDCGLIHTHIKEVICNNDDTLYQYVIQWFAKMFQYPNIKDGIALVVKGQQGTGKSLIFDDLLKKIWGDYAYSTADNNDIAGDFNGVLRNKMYVNFDEGSITNDRKTIGKIKAFITQKEYAFNVKHKQSEKSELNFAKASFTSNEHWVLKIDRDNRRFCVLETSNKYKGNFEYFKRLKDCIDNNADSFLYDMFQVDTTNFDLRDLPHTQAEQEQIENSDSYITKVSVNFSHPLKKLGGEVPGQQLPPIITGIHFGGFLEYLCQVLGRVPVIGLGCFYEDV
jgi:hypothetical protein